MVSRRRLAEMQEREVCAKYLKQQIGDLISSCLLVFALTIAYFLPNIFGGERDPECTMRTGFANAMFGWVLSGAQAIVHLCFILRYLCKESSSSSVVDVCPPSVRRSAVMLRQIGENLLNW